MKKSIIIFFLIALFFSTAVVYAAMTPIGVPKKTLTVGESWDMGGGYALTAQSIDARASPRQAWVVLAKSGVKLDDKILTVGEVYNFGAIFTTKVDTIFAGATSDMVQFVNSSIDLVIPPTLQAMDPRKTLTQGETWILSGGYHLTVQMIDARGSPRQTWIVLSKDGVKLDDKVMVVGEVYQYIKNSDRLVHFTTALNSIFAGATTDMIQLTNTAILSSDIEGYVPVVCTESWTCSSWSNCINRLQSRQCNDQNYCGTTSNKPAVNQSCTPPCTESWSCGSWSQCVNGQQIRTCSDINNCGAFVSQPPLSQSCQSTNTCIESWTCTEWSECINNQQARKCGDSNNCGTSLSMPKTLQSCVTQSKKNTEFSTQYAQPPAIPKSEEKFKEKSDEKSQTVFINGQLTAVNANNKGFSTITTKDVTAATNLNIFIKESKLYVTTERGSIEIIVTPFEALAKANRLNNVLSMELIEENNNIYYFISGTKRANLFLLFPVLAEIQVKVNAETGEVVSGEKPWWSSMAVWF